MSLITLDGIGRTYHLDEQEIHALRSVSLRVERGEYVTLMGPSGSGKSTLMNILGCLDRPSRGSYELDGRQVAGMSRTSLARVRNQKIGFVFQSFNLLARTSALENVMLPLMYSSSWSHSWRREKAMAMLERVGLADRMGHHPGQLSGGQQQRVAIARALANDPPILMADEPTGNLDSRTSRDVMDLFNQLGEESDITIILVTHDAYVARHARRVLVVMDGEVIRDTPDHEEAIAAIQERELT